MKKVLITGITGFVGSHIAEYCLDKGVELFGFKRVDNRWFPDRMIFKDMLKKGEGTEFIIVSIEFDTSISEHLFTKAALR